jgi:hypothetical protein
MGTPFTHALATHATNEKYILKTMHIRYCIHQGVAKG